MKKFKDWFELIFSISFSFLAKTLDGLDLLWLQKIFYLLSIILLLIAIIKLLKGSKFGPEKFTSATGIADQALNPENKAKLIVSVFNKFKLGGKKIMNKFKAFGWVKLLSMVVTILLIILGLLSTVIPGLEFVANNLEAFFVLIGIVSTTGLVSKGRELNQADKEKKELKEKIKETKNNLKELIKEEAALVNEYKWLDIHVERVAKFGGTLTEEQKEAKDIYDQQKATITKIKNEELLKLEELDYVE